jgi:trk system potassium uptake protein TrkA
MNIVVLGAGTVGTSIADLLCQNGHSVTVVDCDAGKIRDINEQLDVRGITGSASRSTILFQAGVPTADICLAVTGNDEVNIVSASMARAMGARRSIARVYAPVFRDLSTFDYQFHFRIDRLMSLEHLTALELAHSLRDPGSIVLEQFARGELEVHEVVVNDKGSAAGKSLRDLDLPGNVRIGTIRRGEKMWIATAGDILTVGDRLLVFSRPEDVANIKSLFRQAQEHRRRIVIAGGGETGFHLARTLERERFKVTLMESDLKRSQFLAKNLSQTSVIHGDATRREVLQEERVGTADAFIACSGNDENNILAGVEARDLGAETIMAVVGRPDYAHVVGKLGIDVAVSEREVMARQILSFLQEGNVLRRQRLPGGEVELVELDVGGGARSVGLALKDWDIPSHCLLVALIRHEFIRVPTASDHLQVGDRVILLVQSHDMDSVVSFVAG